MAKHIGSWWSDGRLARPTLMPMPRSAVARPVIERACPRTVTLSGAGRAASRARRSAESKEPVHPTRWTPGKKETGELAVKTYLGTTRNHRARDDYNHDNNKQLHLFPHTARGQADSPHLTSPARENKSTKVAVRLFSGVVAGWFRKIKSELS